MENRIKKLRKERGLTLQELADLVYPSTVSPQIMKLERGERGLDLNWMGRLSKALNCKPYELLPEEWQPAESGYEIDLQVIVNVIDTIDYFLKQEKVEMPEDDRFKLIKYLYENNVQKDNIIPMIKIWQVANPSIFRKTG